MKLFLLILLFGIVIPASANTYSIGVLAYNGKPQAIDRWQPTATYLSANIPNAQFVVVPLTLEEGINAINKQEIDFILTNPGHYVRLEVNFGVTRIATFLNRYQAQTLKYFSAVIFTRQDSGIQTLKDLNGKTFAAVSEDAFGGFQLAQLALQDQGIDALKDLDMKWLGFPHADIVKAVLEGRAEAGIVRSGVIEKMAAAQQLDISQIRVLAQKQTEDYPFLHSVDLYPEWPFAKLPHTATALSKAVAISLLQMREDDEAARKSGGSGWTIPLTYSSIHEVLHRLQVEPYPPSPLVMSTFWRAYKPWIIILSLFFLVNIIMLIRQSYRNQKLKNTEQALHGHQVELEEVVQHRTDELLQINETLQIEIAAHVQAEKTLREGCESIKSLYSVLTRPDLDRQQKMNSMVDSVRQYLGTEFALLSSLDNGHYKVRSLSPANSNITVPLSAALSQQAIKEQQIVLRENTDLWRSYIACPVFINGELRCLLEFASTEQFHINEESAEGHYSSDLSMNILSLISQWIGNENLMLEEEQKSQASNLEITQRFDELSPRERDVLALLVQGESTKMMARNLGISGKTVEMHRANLLRKTQAKSSTELVQLAVISGIFQPT